LDALIRPATLADIPHVAQAMRVRDVEEVRAAVGLEPAVALHDAVTSSTLCWTAEGDGGVPFAILGVAPYVDEDVGAPWLLATDDIVKYRRQFFTDGPRLVTEMQAAHPLLINYVDARHTDSIRWLRWCGFTVEKLIPAFGFERRPFYRFTKV
jgi:hypothetical protein